MARASQQNQETTTIREAVVVVVAEATTRVVNIIMTDVGAVGVMVITRIEGAEAGIGTDHPGKSPEKLIEPPTTGSTMRRMIISTTTSSRMIFLHLRRRGIISRCISLLTKNLQNQFNSVVNSN